MVWKVRGIALGALLMMFAVWCRADIPPEVVIRAKQATALVEVEEKDGISEGSAFCIDATGLFVTNAHVVEDLKVGGKLTLILRSGEKDQSKVTAHVLALNKESDLAILQTDGPVKVAPLTLGSNEGLIETMSIVAFGYPFGTDLALKEGSYPSITVSTGHITALPKLNGELALIQLDAALNPGNSGGPVLDAKGEVIGIVQEGIPGSGINDAIPITLLRALLARTRLVFTPPAIAKEHLREAQEFRIQLLTPPQGTGEVAVDLTLSTEGSDPRSFHAVSRDGRTFTVRAALLPPRKEAEGLQVTIRSRNSEVVGRVADQSFRVGGVVLSLSQVSQIDYGSSPQVTLVDDRLLHGAITGLGAVTVDLNGAKTSLNLNQFETILVSPPALPASVTYHITATQDGKLFGDLQGKLSLSGVAAVAGGARAPIGSRKAHKGVLIVAADEVATNDSSFDQVPGDSVVHFIHNLADYFTGGKKGKFLVYSNNPAFGNRFQQTLQEAGHTVTQSMTPNSLDNYDGVFVCGNAEVSVQLLAAYIQRGGNVYLAGGTGGNEPKIFNDFLKPFGIEFEPWPNDYSTVQATAFARTPIFDSVQALVIHGPNPIKLLSGDFSHRSVICNQYGHIYWVLYTSDAVASGAAAANPQIAPDSSGYVLNQANGHWYGAVSLDYSLTWREANSAANAMRYKGLHGHLVTITSSAESDFVLRTFPQATNGNYWLGGYKDRSTGWHWVTGEAWGYTNWTSGDPKPAAAPYSDFLQFWNHGHWNDQGDTPPNRIDAVKGFVVEFEP